MSDEPGGSLAIGSLATEERAAALTRTAAWRWVAAGGLTAGLLDITYACVASWLRQGVSPARVFQSVASGLLGRASFAGGAATAALGLALHFAIALAMAFVYFALARRAAVLWRRPWLCGAAYGVGCYVVMSYVVVPLSAAPFGGPREPLWVALAVAVHMLFIGVPCALGARRGLLEGAARPGFRAARPAAMLK